MAFTGYVRDNAPQTGATAFQFNPFSTGVKFRIKDFCFLKMIDGFEADGTTPIFRKNNDGAIITVPGFGTTLGDDIRLTELYRGIVDANGNALDKSTKFTKDLIDILISNRGKSTEEVLTAVVNKFKDVDLIVKSAKPFAGRTQAGDTYTGTFRIYDYAN